MQNILNITLNNNWKNLAPFSLSPKPANTGLSSIVPMTTIAEAKETSFLWELSWNQIYCKELNNLYSGLSTRRYTETTHTYMKSKLFLYTSNNHKENTIETFVTATLPISDFIEGSVTGFWLFQGPSGPLLCFSRGLSSHPVTSFASGARPQTVLSHCSQATDYRQVASTSIIPEAL